ncbi:hypothetical protein KIH86_07215 [Paenibacillus sp. HN-1]|uniref:hypothetical protein n=1 Tax=Paenibacillus TaxID=44249 RepID=UPI001CA8CAA8|nr:MULTISPECIES: hypothetical protein [Paenibacillus]MBY9080448.1 hypothetical protein [Paenibacillus sp. CGMCC 1.18879]MBY9084028.1 hypothetical protein [Paenibacillus sinensis]
MQPSVKSQDTYPSRAATRNGSPVKWFLLFWLIVIVAGGYGAYSYSNHLKDRMVAQLTAQSQQQMAALRSDYEQKLSALSKEVTELQGQVQSFNELLTFTKDNANNKTDNSNKLYTQLNEVRKQLDALQKEMDLLK